MTSSARLEGWVAGWVRLVLAAPRAFWLLLVLLTAGAAWLSVERYSLNSRLADLVQMDSDWRTDWDAYRAAFPQIIDTAVIAVRGDSFGAVEEAALGLEAAVRERSDLFTDVFAPANSALLRDHAFLFMDLDQLDDVGDNLAAAQPLLTAAAEDPSLRGLLGVLATAIDNGSAAELDRVVPRLLASAQAQLAGADARVRWSDEFFAADGEASASFYRLIFMRGVQNFGEALPNAVVVQHLRELIADFPAPEGVRVSLTGEAALQHEEFEAAIGGVQLAGSAAFVLLAIVLALGVRSARIVLATLTLLLVGVTWTTGLAMLTVGEFNTLSLIFLVMFFGLGVDFAIHFSLRLQEGLGSAEAPGDDALAAALLGAARGVGPAIALCSVTTAIGFLGFAPTDYAGLADLGVISAGGMLVAGLLTFTLLPLFYSTFGAPGPLRGGLRMGAASPRLSRGVTVAVTLALLLGGAAMVSRTSFDFSVLALRDPDSESMRTLRELQAEKQLTDYVLFTLTDRDRLDDISALADLPAVESVRTPLDWVPDEQDDKLFALEDLQAVLWSALEPADVRAAATTGDNRAAIEALAAGIEARGEAGDALDELGRALRQIAALDDAGIGAWQAAATDNLVAELEWLRRALTVDALAFEDLPADLRRRLVAPDGRYSSHLIPAQDISGVRELNEFIASVRERVPSGTGRPVVEWGVGGIIVEAFQQALALAVIGIALVLLFALRSVVDTLLVLLPLGLAAGLALGANAIAGVPLNMASVLVLPLVFGLGVDNGIHVVERFRRDGNDPDAYRRSSTPRAVMLSALTTIGTFAALMLSPHRGTSSIGELLALAVGLLLLLTLFLLPSLLALTGGGAGGAAGGDSGDGRAAADQPA
ncbi:MAG: MMPL family transporter [Pseudomonadota bacterium]